ncbi:MAG: hypothetical protein KF683_01335 [Rubrivivax sp.]|nr:hypothetical protein [Rubrivivax sp.]
MEQSSRAVAGPLDATVVPPAPKRVFVPRGKKPPRGVLWASGEVLRFHARPARLVRSGLGEFQEPAANADLAGARELLQRDRFAALWYFKGRNLACPYRCPLDSKTCPVDVLLELANRERHNDRAKRLAREE